MAQPDSPQERSVWRVGRARPYMAQGHWGLELEPPLTGRSLTNADYEGLAAFRLALRRFNAFTDINARRLGLTPQQHQALLSIKGGYPGRQEISIGELADHLLLKNHSAVELVGRLVKAGLVVREPSTADRRRILVRVTRKGEALLRQLSDANLAELQASSILMSGFLASQRERPGASD
jgi:DNA-binding MarR family transcriptional regulator